MVAWLADASGINRNVVTPQTPSLAAGLEACTHPSKLPVTLLSNFENVSAPATAGWATSRSQEFHRRAAVTCGSMTGVRSSWGVWARHVHQYSTTAATMSPPASTCISCGRGPSHRYHCWYNSYVNSYVLTLLSALLQCGAVAFGATRWLRILLVVQSSFLSIGRLRQIPRRLNISQ